MKKFILPAIAIAATAIVAAIIVVTAGNKEDVYRLIKVNSFEGEVTVQREEKMDVFEGLQLISEDEVEVGDKSLVGLLADSDKHIVAEENTSFKLHSTGTENSGNITIDLLYGSTLITIDNKLPDGSTFEVNTPNAALSVRGTTFTASYSSDEEKTVAAVTEGVVKAEWKGGEYSLEKGDEVIITGSGDNIEAVINSAGAPEGSFELLNFNKTYAQSENYKTDNAEHYIVLNELTVNKSGIADKTWSDSQTEENSVTPLNKMYKTVVVAHNEEINIFFEENKDIAVVNNQKQDVTDWFSKKISINGKKFNVTKAVMEVALTASSIDRSYFTSDTFLVTEHNREMYYYASGVNFTLYGNVYEDKEIAETTTAATTTAPQSSHRKTILYSSINFDAYQKERNINSFSALTYKELLDINLPDDYTDYPTLDYRAQVHDSKLGYADVNGDIVVPFAEKLADYYFTHKDEIIKICDEGIKNSFDQPLTPREDFPYIEIETNLDSNAFNWIPKPLIFESEYGSCKINADEISIELSVYLSETDNNGTYPNKFEDFKSGKTYYLVMSNIEIRCYGTSEKISDSEIAASTTGVVTTTPVTTTLNTTTIETTEIKEESIPDRIKITYNCDGEEKAVYFNIPSGYELIDSDVERYLNNGQLSGAELKIINQPSSKDSNIRIVFGENYSELVRKGKQSTASQAGYKLIDQYTSMIGEGENEEKTVYIAERISRYSNGGEYLVFVDCGDENYLTLNNTKSGSFSEIITPEQDLLGGTTDIFEFAKLLFPPV